MTDKNTNVNMDFLRELINNSLNEIDTNKIDEAFLYAFKTKAIPDNKNPYVTLDYNFYDTQMHSLDVIRAVKDILIYLYEKKFNNKENIVFTEYNINNSKAVIDFIKLKNYNFTETDVANGSLKELDSNSYKVEYLLNSIKTNYNVAKSKKDYRGLKHTALKLKSEKIEITIVNKTAPLYKMKSKMFIVDFPENEESCESKVGFKPVGENLLKMPVYPHILIINEYCFFIENNIESLFGFEEFNKKQAELFMKEIPQKIKLDEQSLEMVKSFVGRGKNYNYFADFDNSRIIDIQKKETKALEILKKELKITFDKDNIPIINDIEQAERFVSFLCGTVKQDIYSKEKVIAVNCKPLSIEDKN